MIREHQHKLVMLHAVRTNWKKGGQETSSFRFGDYEYTNITIGDDKITARMLVAKKIQILLLVMTKQQRPCSNRWDTEMTRESKIAISLTGECKTTIFLSILVMIFRQRKGNIVMIF